MGTALALVFVLVCSRSPRDGFRRAGLSFTRAWRPLQVVDDPDQVDIEKGVIDQSILDRLEAEPMLAVKPATQKDIADWQAAQAELASEDPKQQIVDLKAKNADLEARLMRIELAQNGGKKPDDTKKTDDGKKPDDKPKG